MAKAESGSKKSAAKKNAAAKGEAKTKEPAKKTIAKKAATKTATSEPKKRTTAEAAPLESPKRKSATDKTSKAAKPEKSGAKQTAVAEAKPVEIAPPAPKPVEAPPPEPAPVEVAPPAPVETAAPERATAELDNSILPATRGKVAVFGGPKDHSIKPDDKVALPIGRHFTYDRLRSLDARGYYCAMRWNYRFSHMTVEEAKRWWANKKLLVTSPATGHAVVVRAVDYGPHEKTGLDIGLSPGAAAALSLNVGDEVDIAFADQKSPLGPVSKA
ncbi:MAG: hypothetical protein AB1631_16485 [Acidobacteriota bacterium]